jgi:hypothetical protein
MFSLEIHSFDTFPEANEEPLSRGMQQAAKEEPP